MEQDAEQCAGDDWLTVPQIAALLQTSHTTILRVIGMDEPASYRPDGRCGWRCRP
jgi:hypothetical protein